MDKPKIVMLTTGGTIVSSGTSAGQMTGYTFRGIQVSDLLESIPPLADVAEIELEEPYRLPSSCVNMEAWLKLAQAVEKACDREDVDGVVITHGTDTMEETAFFLNLVLNTKKPVVLTGSMRPATAISADGYLNILNAVRVAASPLSYDRGVLIVMNGIINGARDTTKTNTLAVETFKALEYGMLGYVVGDEIEFLTQSLKPHTHQTEFSINTIDNFQSLPRVDIIYAHADDDGIFVKAAMEAGAKGIIHAGTGHGSISYAVEAALYEAAKNGCIVVRASRVVTGAVLNGHQRWQDAGFIPSRTLSAQKSRILLQLLLHRYGPDVKKIAKGFKRY